MGLLVEVEEKKEGGAMSSAWVPSCSLRTGGRREPRGEEREV